MTFARRGADEDNVQPVAKPNFKPILFPRTFDLYINNSKSRSTHQGPPILKRRLRRQTRRRSRKTHFFGTRPETPFFCFFQRRCCWCFQCKLRRWRKVVEFLWTRCTWSG